MQSVLRVGVVAGVLGSVALYGLARTSGLVAAYGIILLGFAAGLAMAKWLDWSWYGRQLEAGAQAGALACIPAAALSLVALLSQSAHSVGALETNSHLGPLTAGGLAHAFGFSGWAGADILSIVFSTLFAIGLAALTSIVMAWSKSGRAVRSVNQAHEAARSLRGGTWAPALTTAVPAVQGTSASIPAWQGVQSQSAGRAEASQAWPAVPPQTTAQPALGAPAPVTFSPSDQTIPRGSKPPANSPANDEQLRAAMREALSMWGDESGEHEAGPPSESGDSSESSAKNGKSGATGEKRRRAPHASQFLNDAKKRGRKKTDTRDWLC